MTQPGAAKYISESTTTVLLFLKAVALGVSTILGYVFDRSLATHCLLGSECIAPTINIPPPSPYVSLSIETPTIYVQPGL